MPCARVLMGDAETGYDWGFMCGPGVKPCAACSALADYQCDYPMGRGKTCDAYLCERHAISQGFPRDNQLKLFADPDPETELHFCPTHDLIQRGGKS